MQQTEFAPDQVGSASRPGGLSKAKKPVLFGGLIVGVMYLASLLPGLGFGLGGGTGDGDGKAGTVQDNKETEGAETPAVPDPSPTLYVVIDGFDYLVREFFNGKARYRKVALEEILTMAQKVEGDEQAIRVWIAKTLDAKNSALYRLQTGLWKPIDEGGAGMKVDEVQVQQDYVLNIEAE